MPADDRRADDGQLGRWLGGTVVCLLAGAALAVAAALLVGVTSCADGCRIPLTLTSALVALVPALVAVALQAVAFQTLQQAGGRPRPGWVAATTLAVVLTVGALAAVALAAALT